MRFLLKFSRLMDQISEWAGILSTGIVLITIVIGFYNVMARYIGREIGVTLSSNVFIEIQCPMAHTAPGKCPPIRAAYLVPLLKR